MANETTDNKTPQTPAEAAAKVPTTQGAPSSCA